MSVHIETFLVPKEGLTETLREILEPAVVDMAFELVDMQLVRGQTRTKVRLFVDVAGDGRIDLDGLEKVNRRVSDLIDVEDAHRGLFRTAWDLEVSSPGIDRPLSKKSHFSAVIDQQIKVRTRIALAGARAHVGRLVSANDDGFTLVAHDTERSVEIPWSNFENANVVFDFGHMKKRPKKNAKQQDDASDDVDADDIGDDNEDPMSTVDESPSRKPKSRQSPRKSKTSAKASATKHATKQESKKSPTAAKTQKKN